MQRFPHAPIAIVVKQWQPPRHQRPHARATFLPDFWQPRCWRAPFTVVVMRRVFIERKYHAAPASYTQQADASCTMLRVGKSIRYCIRRESTPPRCLDAIVISTATALKLFVFSRSPDAMAACAGGDLSRRQNSASYPRGLAQHFAAHYCQSIPSTLKTRCRGM